MALLARITDFIPGNAILSGEVDSEFNQLVNILNGTSTNKNAIMKYSDSGDPPLALDQLGAGPVQVWRASGVEKARMKNNGQIVGVGKTVHTNVTATGNVGGGLDNLHSFTLPAGSLNANNDYVEAIYAGTFSTNDNNKRIVISFGSQTVDDSSLQDQDSGSWEYRITYFRLSSTSVRFVTRAVWGIIAADGAASMTGSNGRVFTNTNTIAVADMSLNNLPLLVQAEGTANNDIQQILSIVQLTQNT